MNRATGWTIGIALVVAAGAATALTPRADLDYRAFLIRGETDAAVASRTLIAEATDATFADEVSSGDWSADGHWLVVTVTASAPVSELDSALGQAMLVVGDRTFRASERPGSSPIGEDLRIGLDTTGMLAFELPDDVRTGVAELRLSSEISTPRLDDVISLTILLDDLPTASSVELVEPEVIVP